MVTTTKRTKLPGAHIVIISCLALLCLSYYGVSLWSLRMLPKEPSIFLKATLTAPDHASLPSQIPRLLSKPSTRLTEGVPEHLWLTETKVIHFLNSYERGGKFGRPALYDLISRKWTPLLALGKSAINAEKVLPSPDGAHLLWRDSFGTRKTKIKSGSSAYEVQRPIYGKFVVSDLNGVVLQTYAPPKDQEIAEFEWVDDSHWVAWLIGNENGYEQIQARAIGDLAQPNIISIVKTQPTERYKQRYELMKLSDIHTRLTPTLTVGEWNRMISSNDYSQSQTFLAAPPFEQQRFIALSGDRKKLAWMTSHPMNAPVEKWYAGFLARPIRELRTRYSFWLSDADGSKMRRLGGIDLQDDIYTTPSAVEWLPGGRSFCIRFQGKLWVFPAEIF